MNALLIRFDLKVMSSSLSIIPCCIVNCHLIDTSTEASFPVISILKKFKVRRSFVPKVCTPWWVLLLNKTNLLYTFDIFTVSSYCSCVLYKRVIFIKIKFFSLIECSFILTSNMLYWKSSIWLIDGSSCVWFWIFSQIYYTTKISVKILMHPSSI